MKDGLLILEELGKFKEFWLWVIELFLVCDLGILIGRVGKGGIGGIEFWGLGWGVYVGFWLGGLLVLVGCWGGFEGGMDKGGMGGGDLKGVMGGGVKVGLWLGGLFFFLDCLGGFDGGRGGVCIWWDGIIGDILNVELIFVEIVEVGCDIFFWVFRNGGLYVVDIVCWGWGWGLGGLDLVSVVFVGEVNILFKEVGLYGEGVGWVVGVYEWWW